MRIVVRQVFVVEGGRLVVVEAMNRCLPIEPGIGVFLWLIRSTSERAWFPTCVRGFPVQDRIGEVEDRGCFSKM